MTSTLYKSSKVIIYSLILLYLTNRGFANSISLTNPPPLSSSSSTSPLPQSREFQVLTLEQLKKDSDWWKIYDESFPGDEKEDPAQTYKAIEDHVVYALSMKENNHTIGIATFQIFNQLPASFLGFIAIKESERNRKLGGELFQQAYLTSMQKLKEKGQKPLGMVLEIEDPNSAKDANDQGLRAGRKRFYEKQGAETISTSYLQPSLQGDRKGIPMELLFKKTEHQEKVTPQLVTDLTHAIYYEGYHLVNGVPIADLTQLLEKAQAASSQSLLPPAQKCSEVPRRLNSIHHPNLALPRLAIAY